MKTQHAHTKERTFAQRPNWDQMECPSEKESCQDTLCDDLRVNSPRKPNNSRCIYLTTKTQDTLNKN